MTLTSPATAVDRSTAEPTRPEREQASREAIDLLVRAAQVVTRRELADALGLRLGADWRREAWRLRRDAFMHRSGQLLADQSWRAITARLRTQWPPAP